MSLKSDPVFTSREVSNIILDVPGGDETSTVVVGAGMGSGILSPGMNRGGSGTAAVLEVLRVFGERFGFEDSTEVKNAMRFCLWTCSGAEHYVDNLPDVQKGHIAGYLQFDALGSKMGTNSFIRGINSTQDGNTQDLFEEVFGALGQESTEWRIRSPSFMSPYEVWWDSGIPAGGLYSGGREKKSVEEASKFGGSKGDRMDVCSLRACDTVDNVDMIRMLTLTQVGATVIEKLAMDGSIKEHLHPQQPSLAQSSAMSLENSVTSLAAENQPPTRKIRHAQRGLHAEE